MRKEIKSVANTVLAAVGLAMGVGTIVIPIVNADAATDSIVRMLSIAVVSLGLWAVNNISKTGERARSSSTRA